MKKIQILILLFISSGILFAQNIYNNGANIVITSGANLILKGDYINESSGTFNGAMVLDGAFSLTGNYTNNANSGSGLADIGTNGETIFNGSGSQTISGSSPEGCEFENFTVNGGSYVKASVPVTVRASTNLSGSVAMVEIEAHDFTALGELSGSGLFKAANSGYLKMTPAKDSPAIYPISDGVSDYSVTITLGADNSNSVGAKIFPIDNRAALTPKFIDITGDDNLNATIRFRFPKSALVGNRLPNKYSFKAKNGSIFETKTVTTEDKGSYYEITLNNINKF